MDCIIREGLQPMIVRAPEVILGYKLSSATDIWSVGFLVRLPIIHPISRTRQLIYYLIVKLVAGHFLLEQGVDEEENGEFSFDRHLKYISVYLGPFTKEYLDKCPEEIWKEYFDDDGEPITHISLSDRF